MILSRNCPEVDVHLCKWRDIPDVVADKADNDALVLLCRDDETIASSDFSALVSMQEQKRADAFVLPELKRWRLFSQSALRLALGAFLGVSPCSIVFGTGKWGKPYVIAPVNFLQVNMSHSQDACAICLSKNMMVGVDVELCRNDIDIEQISNGYFAGAEQAAIAGAQRAEKNRIFFTLWTLKEAFIKMTGTGLSTPLDSFAVSLTGEHGATVSMGGTAVTNVFLRHGMLAADFAWAVAVLGHVNCEMPYAGHAKTWAAANEA